MNNIKFILLDLTANSYHGFRGKRFDVYLVRNIGVWTLSNLDASSSDGSHITRPSTAVPLSRPSFVSTNFSTKVAAFLSQVPHHSFFSRPHSQCETNLPTRTWIEILSSFEF